MGSKSSVKLTMNLSSEDQLRLNVLVAQPLQAVRIDESRMCVHALSDKGEARVQLNPNCKDEKYIRLIRQFLSTHFLGSPGGYPVFLRRWTRMGQARDESLEKLLLIGEPEAVTAVVHASGLTDELARRAWWTSENAENARRMLEKESVVNGKMGKQLAKFLVEFLPFEEQQKAIIESVRLVLQQDLISSELRDDLWKRAKRKNSYYVGFLQQTPHSLPTEVKCHEKWKQLSYLLDFEVKQGNTVAKLLNQLYSPAGQAYLQTLDLVLKKPNDQDVVVELFNTIGEYFKEANNDAPKCRDIQSLSDHADEVYANSLEAEKILAIDSSLKSHIKAIYCLSLVNETLVDPIFGMTDAIGSVMRKKIEPVITPISQYLELFKS